ncbi:hypothetical protein Zmor_025905 [Zophobas morio]|uniref:Secreted protein n=1 Tax=Zophobas morio TaxID=2755281 RepID=A0AA38HSM7_9CUCU|nr:hypothetical protein Zmor_025905 [Zophobas morio]
MLLFKLCLVFSSVSGTLRIRTSQGNDPIVAKALIFLEFYEFWICFDDSDHHEAVVNIRVDLFCEKETFRHNFRIPAFVDSRNSLKNSEILLFMLCLVFSSVSGTLRIRKSQENDPILTRARIFVEFYEF